MAAQPYPPMPSTQALQELIQGPSDVEWKYDMRHKCQEILPGLFLGPFVVSKSLETLSALGISHIVCIRDAKEAFSVRPRFPEHFTYMTVDVSDSEEQNLIRSFPSAQKFIDDALAARGRVLVHCNGGISLSPSFVIMFVMQHHQLSWEDALHLVQNRRYCISPNGGFLTQLKEYESIYRATIAVQQFNPPTQLPRVVSRRKREDSDEEDSAQTRDKRLIVSDGKGGQTVRAKRSFVAEDDTEMGGAENDGNESMVTDS